MTKLSDAISIRNAVLPSVLAHGDPISMLPGVPIKHLRRGSCSLTLIGPFRSPVGAPLPLPASTLNAGPLLHRLEVNSGGKVLSMEWNEADTIDLIRFKRGDWEAAAIHPLEAA